MEWSHFRWYGVYSKAKEESNILEPLGLQGLQVLYCMESHESHTWLHVRNEARKVWRSYRLVGNTVCKIKISKVFVKQSAQDIKYLRRMSFAGIAKTQADCFKGSGDTEKENLLAKGSNRGLIN